MRQRNSRAFRAATLAAVLAVALATTSCDLLLSLVAPPDTTPVTPTPTATVAPQAERTMPPTQELPDPQMVVTTLLASGWKEVVVAEADLRLLVPSSWPVVRREDLPGLGDFDGLPSGSREREEFERVREQMRDRLVAYSLQPFSEATMHPVLVHLTAWADAGGVPVNELATILVDRRLEEDEWFEIGSITTELGDVWRVHYWLTTRSGPRYSLAEYVFRAPNGEAYTLSFLIDERSADQDWTTATLVASTMRPR